MTTVTYELDLVNFDFWAGGADNAAEFSYTDLQKLEGYFNDCFDTISQTEINDIFWFEPDCLAQYLGYRDFECMVHGEPEDNEEEDEV